MQLYPAINMKNRQCVRLRQGAFRDITIHSDTSKEVVAHWQEKGASFLHLIDLDDALAGYSVNKEVVRRTTGTVSISIEIGDGIRSGEAVERMLGLGVRYVTIETKAVERPGFLRDIIKMFGREAIMADVDVKDDIVTVEGWGKVSSLTIRDLCLTMKEYGVRHVAYTDISRDGMLSGPNVEVIKKLTEETELDIIASGGVPYMGGLKCLHEASTRGAIVDKALHENRVDLAEAVRLCEV